MKIKVTFREYTLPYPDGERGEYIGSFDEVIEGETPAEIMKNAGKKAEEYSEKYNSDVRVWMVPVTFTPRGIVSE